MLAFIFKSEVEVYESMEKERKKKKKRKKEEIGQRLNQCGFSKTTSTAGVTRSSESPLC